MKEKMSRETAAEPGHFGYLDHFKCERFFSLRKVELKNMGERREVYFLGENGDGKTLILQGIMLALMWKAFADAPKTLTAAAFDLPFANPGTRMSALGSNQIEFSLEVTPDEPDRAKWKVKNGKHPRVSAFGYGVNRGRSSGSVDIYGAMTLFNPDQTLRNPSEWLKKLYTVDLERIVEPGKHEKPGPPSLETVKGMLAEIFNRDLDILVDSESVTYVERGTKLELAQLSEGYRSVMTWVLDLLQGLALDQPQVTDIKDYRGIVLVDEISLHLHPRWELSLVRQLRTWFPGLQFLLTTHSPITVMGASDDAVFYRVYKQSGETMLSEPFEMKCMEKMLANALITSPLFGLDDARMKALGDQDAPNTSETYLHEQIYQGVRRRLAKTRSQRPYLSPQKIQAMIDEALDEAVGS